MLDDSRLICEVLGDCRTASWPTLLEMALRKSYGTDGFAAYELVPLRRQDVAQAATLSGIEDANAFLTRIDELQVASFAIKPVTLGLLIGTYLRDGDLPANVIDLYEEGCGILCEEQNDSRRAAGRVGFLSPKGRVEVASRIAAATQFGNRYAVWTGTAAAGVPIEVVPIGELAGGVERGDGEVQVTNGAVLETLGTGLFSSRGQERLGWAHQTYAEFLAARYCVVHDLPLQQLRSLVFHPRRNRVIPQVREVASWIAIQNPVLFDQIAEADPEILLGSAAAGLSERQREIATTALLKSCDEGEFLHIHHNLQLRSLSHPRLAEQLMLVFADRDRCGATRYLAVNIARDCNVQGLGSVLADVALSDAESHDMRAIAAFALADIGSDEDRTRLKPLLGASREIDPNDEIRGAALRAVYPGEEYDNSMWDYLEHPRQSNLFGAYNSFLTYVVLPKLNATNLPAALRWCQAQEPDDIGPIAELQLGILSLALEQIEAEGVADFLAQAILRRIKSGMQMPPMIGAKRRRSSKSFSQTLAEDDARRRPLLAALLPLLDYKNVYLLTHPLSFLVPQDVDWLLHRVVNGRSPASEQVECWMISRLACSWEPTVVDAVWHACQRNVTLANECKYLFDPVSLDSDHVLWARKSKADLLKENNIQVAPPLEPRCEAALQRSEGGDVDAWLSLQSEMSVDEGGTCRINLWEIEVEKLPGWIGATDEMKGRIVCAAKAFLTQTTFREMEWFPCKNPPNGAFAGVNALVLLNSLDPDYLRKQGVEFWVHWIASLIADPRTHYEKNEGATEVFRLAATIAPEAMNTNLLAQLECESRESKFFFSAALIELAWSKPLGQLLLSKLKQDDLIPGVQGDVLHRLLEHKVSGAKEWAEEAIEARHDGEGTHALARALLMASDDAGWATLWPIIQNDVAFGRALLEDASYGQPDRATFTRGLSDRQLGDLYIWLLEQYPPDDRLVSGAMGPLDTVRFLRDGTLEQLKKRSTFEACDALARAELHFPHYRWLRFHFDQAEVMACAATWEAQSSRDIISMVSDAQKRFVESSAQLLEVIMESLDRLQAELHGELASVGDLWNTGGGEWWPKEEEDVSDYVARHLKKDLGDRGIIFNREVQIRRTRGADMRGQNTDIHVDAVPAEGSKAQLYGKVSVILEVKGTWNRGLMPDMEGQLRDRYLKNNDCFTGLYLAAHFKATNWKREDRRRSKCDAINIEELRRQLANQAVALSSGVLLRSVVLDMSLDSTVTTGVH